MGLPRLGNKRPCGVSLASYNSSFQTCEPLCNKSDDSETAILWRSPCHIEKLHVGAQINRQQQLPDGSLKTHANNTTSQTSTARCRGFSAEVPGSREHRRAVPTVPHLNSWPTESVSRKKKKLFYVSKICNDLLHSNGNWNTLFGWLRVIWTLYHSWSHTLVRN